jgi:Tfp pilus assembly protein PilF
MSVACGGSAKPPDAPYKDEQGASTTAAKSSSASSASPAASNAPGKSGTGFDGPAAKSTSDDVTRGISALKAGNYNDARSAFEAAIAKNPKQADAHYYLALVMDKTGDRAAAEKGYRQALSLSADLPEAAENLIAVYIEEKKFDEAVEVARGVLARNPKNSEVQLNYAVALAGKGDQDSATKAFEDAVKLAPNDARFFLTYSEQLALWKKKDEALQKLKQAQRVAGDDPGLLGTIGFAFRTQRAVPECIATMDRAIALKDNADFRTVRATCKFAAKDKPGAMADVEAAIAQDAKYPVAHYWHGVWLHEDGKFPEAAAEYTEYLKLAPNGPLAKGADAKLKLAKDKKKK